MTTFFLGVEADTVECSERVKVDSNEIECVANRICSDLYIQVALLKVSRRDIVSTDCIDTLATRGKYLITECITIILEHVRLKYNNIII